MTRTRTGSSDPACESCGRLPHPRKARLALVKLFAVFPIEFALHGVVLWMHPPFLVGVSLLALSTTLLVIWVVEPAAMRLLRSWLHAPALRSHERLLSSAVLWRVRAVVEDRPGDLERLASELAHLGVNILSVHVHPLERGALDELVLATPGSLTVDTLVGAVRDAGGHDVQAWPTTALSLADGQARALGLAARVVTDPDELPWAVAELLGARLCDPSAYDDREAPTPAPETPLVLPTRRAGTIVVQRPGEPFTPAERARAQALADLSVLPTAPGRTSHRQPEHALRPTAPAEGAHP